MEIIIDATNCVMGRLASRVGKELAKGSMVHVVNVEKAVVSGDPVYLKALYKQKIDRGDPTHGPFYPKTPDLMFRRVVRGMLPKTGKGRDALKKLRVYISMPHEMKGKKAICVKGAENKLSCKYTELGALCEKIGANVRW